MGERPRLSHDPAPETLFGRGYAGERVDALLQLPFEELDIGIVSIPRHGENDRSFRAVEKYVDRYGGRLRNHAGRYGEPADHYRFSISQSDYVATTDATISEEITLDWG